MKFYIQVNTEGYITDCITMPHEGYIPCELSVPLPDKLIAGCYKYIAPNGFALDTEKLRLLEPPDEYGQLRADLDYVMIMGGLQ